MSELSNPRSAVHPGVALTGLAAFVGAALIVKFQHPFADDVQNALLMIAIIGIVLCAVDVGWQKVHRRASTGLDFSRWRPSIRRTLVKLLGFLGTLGLVAGLYLVLPEYHSDFYQRYYSMLQIVVPVLLVAVAPYFYVVDGWMREPHDGYWHLANVLLFSWREVDRRLLGQHVLGWLVKAYFLPLMFTYMCDDVGNFRKADLDGFGSFKDFYDFSYNTVFFVDVSLVSLGYLLTLRITDTHIRSSEPTFFGWAIALICYEPFLSFFSGAFLAYDTDYPWGAWLWNHPLAYGIWGSTIILLLLIYIWGTLSFGGRFSNLTHRGILTNGAYRWTKHPAYVSKNLSWWMISVPFLAHEGAGVAVQKCILLLGVNLVYFLRARTEERHLSRDPVYVEYAHWMNEHGVFSRLTALKPLRWLQYRSPAEGRRL